MLIMWIISVLHLMAHNSNFLFAMLENTQRKQTKKTFLRRGHCVIYLMQKFCHICKLKGTHFRPVKAVKRNFAGKTWRESLYLWNLEEHTTNVALNLTIHHPVFKTGNCQIIYVRLWPLSWEKLKSQKVLLQWPVLYSNLGFKINHSEIWNTWTSWLIE